MRTLLQFSIHKTPFIHPYRHFWGKIWLWTQGFGWVPYKGLMWIRCMQPQTACIHCSTNNYRNTAFYVISYTLLYLLFFSFIVSIIMCVCVFLKVLTERSHIVAFNSRPRCRCLWAVVTVFQMLDYIIFDSKNVPRSILFTEMYERVWGEKSGGKDSFFFSKIKSKCWE